MSNFTLRSSVVFIIFNRPELTKQVFAEIAKVKPPKLLVIGDGARDNFDGEIEKVAAARAIINLVDWDCDVLTNYSEVNLGCKLRVSSGLDWAFKQVEEAIVLEDDCLPSATFFRFCEEMLEYYRDDQRIGMISGDNFQFGHTINDDSYYFSNINHIWGWATWRSRWQHDYDVTMKNWPAIRDEGRVADWSNTMAENDYLTDIFNKVYECKIDTWDYQWNFGSRLNGRVSVMPNVNLISNIGFGKEATHTKGRSLLASIPLGEMCFPLKHPVAFFANTVLDTRYFKNFIHQIFLKRLFLVLTNLVRKY